jgi:hypothetical protein
MVIQVWAKSVIDPASLIDSIDSVLRLKLIVEIIAF